MTGENGKGVPVHEIIKDIVPFGETKNFCYDLLI